MTSSTQSDDAVGTRMKLAFVGNEQDAVLRSVEAGCELAPFSAAGLSEVEAVVFAGTADTSELASILAAGKAAAFPEPSAAQVAAVRTMTGIDPTQNAAGFVVAGARETGYHFSLIPKSGQMRTLTIREGGTAEQHELVVPPPPLAQQLVKAVVATNRSGVCGGVRGGGPASSERMTLQSSGSGLLPPPGATFGQSSGSLPGFTSSVSTTNDKNAGSNSQTVTTDIYFTFYVYYVDGEGGAPYYIVILKQTGDFNPGTMLANNSDSRGYFLASGQVNAQVYQPGNTPFPSGVTMLWHSPSTFGSSPTVPVYIQSVSMTLEADDGSGGSAPTAFTPVENANIYLQDWGCLDQTAGTNPGWLFHQTTTYDPTVDQFADWSSWYRNVFGSDNSVDQVPALSTGTVTYETLTVWQFSSSLISQGATGRDLWVTFTGSATPMVAFIDNKSGSNNNSYNLDNLSYVYGWVWTINLGAVAVKTP